MKVLLSDGTGLTARQVVVQLGRAGHTVDVLAPDGSALTRSSRWVRRVHSVPPLGWDPYAWLDRALAVLRSELFDVLLPTHEQVAVLSREADQVRALGPGLAVPPFPALLRVQDKVSAAATLAELGLPQPPSTVAGTEAALLRARLPAFVKVPIGTASNGVYHVRERAGLGRLAPELAGRGVFDDGGVLVQEPAAGPIVMVQSVFDGGRLVAWHANLRTREGSSGGASGKRSVAEPVIGEHLARLGGALGWHGALCLDAVLTPDGPQYIDVNPRLVEPGNAYRSGTDLASLLIRISLGERPDPVPPGLPDVATHQLVQALLVTAGHGRLATVRELASAAVRIGPYRGSAEELTPARGDLRGLRPVLFLVAGLLAKPDTIVRLARGTVSNHALTPSAWRQITRAGAGSP
jgi:hypothetical protein